jgi:uncharacterized membrane protein YgaE (UPF0421/DUF939 family)
MASTESRLFGLVLFIGSIVAIGFVFKIEFIVNAFFNLLFIAIAIGVVIALFFYALAFLEDFVKQYVGPVVRECESLTKRIYSVENKQMEQRRNDGERIERLEQELKKLKDEQEKMKSPVGQVTEEVLQNFL